MKRRCSPRFSPNLEPAHIPVQDQININNKIELTCTLQDHIDMDTKMQSTRTYRRRTVEGSSHRGKTTFIFDLNAMPDGALPTDVVDLASQVGMPQGTTSQSANTPIDVETTTVQPTIELIDVEESALQAANAPIDVEVSTVQASNEPVDVEGVNQLSNPSTNVERSVVQPSNAPMVVEVVDDNITIFSSLRGLAQGQNRSRGAGPDTIVLDEESYVTRDPSGPGTEDPLTILTLAVYPSRRSVVEAYRNLDDSHDTKKKTMAVSPEPQEEPKEPAFCCAVCWGPLVEETSTICGHIFCQACIKAAIKAQKRCPTCRRTLNKRNIHRVYLPTAN